jgi:hypothetical protein
MKTNALFNPAFFRRFDDTSQSINSSLMVCHPLKDKEGVFTGNVYQRGKFLGNFTISNSPNEKNTQADIDLASFISERNADCCKDGVKNVFAVKLGGYMVFFTSNGENGFHVELKSGEAIIYSTQKLQKNDLVVTIILRPGLYEILGSTGKCSVSVEVPKETDDLQKNAAQATNISLTEKGFSKTEIKASVGSGLVIALETDSNIDIKFLKPYEVPSPQRPLHRWVKPQKGNFKKK